MSNYPLPKKIADALINNPQSDNFGLLFSRLQQIKDNTKKKDDKEKYKIWKNLVEESQRIYAKEDDKVGVSHFLTGLHQRLDKLENAYTKLGFNRLEKFEMKVDWRLVIGLGNPSVLDTGLRLHSIYGFPYLPGQGLKGAVRNTWMNKKAEKLGIQRLTPKKIKERDGKTPWKTFENLLISAKREINASEDKFNFLKNEVGIKNLDFETFFQKYIFKYQELFGGANGQGKVNFLDVLPTKLIVDDQTELIAGDYPIFKDDIINPHYGEYYTSEGKTPPADYLSPKPIFFLAVRINTPFRFRVLAKDKKLLREVKSLIAFTAREYGLGAKTMSGYGEMCSDDE